MAQNFLQRDSSEYGIVKDIAMGFQNLNKYRN